MEPCCWEIPLTTEFNLPGSSFEEVQKILRGYSHAPDQVQREALSKLTGLNPTIISRNSKFLEDIGLIAGGRQKGATELGRKLGRALDHKQNSDAQRYWKEAVQTNEKVAGLVTTVRIKNGMNEKDFTGHVLYVSGQINNPGNRTGARCVVDLLLFAGLLADEDGKLVVATPAVDGESSAPTTESLSDLSNAQNNSEPPHVSHRMDHPASRMIPSLGIPPQIAINIQLHLPETENAEVYEKLFKALRENLLAPPAK